MGHAVIDGIATILAPFVIMLIFAAIGVLFSDRY